VNRAAARFILRTGGAGSKGSGQLQLGAFDVAVEFVNRATALFILRICQRQARKAAPAFAPAAEFVNRPAQFSWHSLHDVRNDSHHMSIAADVAFVGRAFVE
jgi:hypothetical protein